MTEPNISKKIKNTAAATTAANTAANVVATARDTAVVDVESGVSKPKMLYRVLLEEYENLGILDKNEADDFKEIIEQRKEDLGVRNLDEIKKIPDRHEREREIQEQFDLRGKFRLEMLARLRQKIHQKAKGHDSRKISALCLSGGGIRSATFSLGVLQALAKHNLLSKFDYLSTVSGGGYIGSWFSAWLYREGSVAKVQAALCRNKIHPFLLGLKDFDIDLEEYDEDSIDRVYQLQKKLNENLSFFSRDELDKIAVRQLPSKSALLDNSGELLRLRAFVRDLCEELNQILLEIEAGSQGKSLTVMLENVRKKRLAIGQALGDIIKPPDETDIIEPYEISHLRSFSNYMSPQASASSTDMWTLIAVYLRNLLLNWTVFVPLLAAILLLPQAYYSIISLQPDTTLQFIILLIATVCGLIGVINLNAMRPTLGKFSWVDLRYRTDDIGELQSAEKKVLWWCVLPLVALAFLVNFYWVWISYEEQPKFPLSYLFDAQLGAYVNPTLVHLTVFSVILFFGGFLASRVTLLFRGEAKKPKGLLKNFTGEFLISFFSAALGGALLFLVVYLLGFSDTAMGENRRLFYACFGAPLFLISLMLSTVVFIGLASKITDDMDREWAARLGAWLLLIAVGWTILSGVVLWGPKLFEKWIGNSSEIAQTVIAAIGGVSGLITLVLGFSRKSSTRLEQEEDESRTSFLLRIAPTVAAPVFALFLAVLIVYGTNALIKVVGNEDNLPWMAYTDNPWKPETDNLGNKHVNIQKAHQAAVQNFYVIAIWSGILAGIGILAGFFININKFSLHATYRERLIRAYLGASRAKERIQTADSFTGLDGDDNLEMKNLLQKPFHVINMTLNMVKSNNLRWQNRKAESFTATALHCGSSNMGGGSGNYRNSDHYAYNQQNTKAMTLGTAASISGAAASPNMGYYTSSAAVSFLMTLFNIRLGWWLGNTGRRGNDTCYLPAPRFSPGPFFAEALGMTNDTSPYIYLSDGGHFENLGLYEMVLRRCHFIVACDAGADSKFGFFDFGTAIHKIRVDMGIPIEFVKENAPVKGRNCGIATIKYSTVDGRGAEDGILIYIKPTLDGNEPIDVVNYSRTNKDFPHETTADQLYSETQFESYRSLGFHMIDSICCGEPLAPCKSCLDLPNLRKFAAGYLDKLNKKPARGSVTGKKEN